ncbi:MAG: acyl carrier protein [Bacteroidales bacterium]|jgi:acyl carrier protein|nr:acyl carrier protein [Bacteroidales bacterium]MDD4214114.1 acyl carrier protein [Bacteroidales bacterium]
MDINELIKKIEAEFEDLKPGSLKPESRFRKVLDWNSVNALTIIALVDSDYDVLLTAEDFMKSETVQDVYNIIVSRMKK